MAKAPRIQVLRCLNPQCRGMLAYEVEPDNVLHVDLAWTARRDGDLLYFPCPHCGGRNVVEPCTRADGRPGHRVSRFEPEPAGRTGSAPTDDELDLIPRAVRDKLDRTGIRLHLAEWRQLPLAQRRRLCELPCATDAEAAAYRDELVRAVVSATGREPERLPADKPGPD